jgi:hypothetical protein
MTTSLDEPRHLERPRPGWTQLGIMLGVVLIGIIAVVTLVSMMVEVHNDQYDPSTAPKSGTCDWTIHSYRTGDAEIKQRLEQQYQDCR